MESLRDFIEAVNQAPDISESLMCEWREITNSVITKEKGRRPSAPPSDRFVVDVPISR